MNFMQAVKAYFINWNNFTTRSSRSEYWWATLFVSFGSYIAGFIIGFFIMSTFSAAGFSEDVSMTVIGIAALVIEIFLVIAGISLSVRRLHDVDKSGWWLLIMFTIIGMIPLLIWYCTKGTDGENRFGQNPLEQQK